MSLMPNPYKNFYGAARASGKSAFNIQNYAPEHTPKFKPGDKILHKNSAFGSTIYTVVGWRVEASAVMYKLLGYEHLGFLVLDQYHLAKDLPGISYYE